MHRLTRTRYRWLRRVGALLGAVSGFVVDLHVIAAEDAAFERAGTHRVDYFPAEVPILLAIGALVGWSVVVLTAHLLDVVPLDATQAEADSTRR
jgi:hypothetical protein